MIGLGSGTLACASEPGETWKFFEIDQSMVDTARDPKYFTYIQKCAPDLKPVIGDARLTFAREPDGIYDLIIVDAYSSDAIPIHLATQEAMKIYKDKLAPQGVVVMHVSNRHLELASVVVGIADANDLKSWVYDEDSGRDDEYIFATDVVVSAREEADVGKLASSDNGRRPSRPRASGSGPTIIPTCWARCAGGCAMASSSGRASGPGVPKRSGGGKGAFSMHDKVDVLIIGSGASGAAVAWSLAETRMRILCLEQGDWMKPIGLSRATGGTGRRG